MILARTLSIAPTTDGEHCDLQLREEQDIIYTDAYAQNPLPFQRVSSLAPPWRRPYPWQPAALVWPSYDALYPNGYSFDYTVNTSTVPATLDIYGRLPVNTPPAPPSTAAIVPLQATTSNTGGSIPPGTYLIAIGSTLFDGPVSKFITVVIPTGTNTNMIAVSGVMWRQATTATLYIGTSSLSVTKLFISSWTGSSLDGFGNPTAFTITALISTGEGLPDLNAKTLLVQVKNIRHGGVWGDVITSVAGTIVTVNNIPWPSGQWNGYVLSLYFRPGVNFQPGLDIQVTSSTPTELNMAHAGFLPGDVVVMRAAASSITSNTIGDANFANTYAPSGLATNAEVGSLVRIIAGTGAHQPPMAIASNTGTVLTIVGTWYIEPDSTSVYIVEAPNWIFFGPAVILNDGSAGPGSFGQRPIVSIPLPDLISYSLLIEGITVDASGDWSIERYAPLREGYVQQLVGGSVNALVRMALSGTTITPDATHKYNIFQLTSNVTVALPSGAPVYPLMAELMLILQQGTGPAVFSGSGLNDATGGGSYSSVAANDSAHTYVAQISATGSPDHFTWARDGGAVSAPVAITGAAQTLMDGITITFAATTGHHIGDSWSIQSGGFNADISAYGSAIPYQLSNPYSPAATECVQSLLVSTTTIRTTAPAQMNTPIT